MIVVEDELDPLPPPSEKLQAERRDEAEPGRTARALVAAPDVDDRGIVPQGKRPPRPGAVISAILHLALVAALLWLVPLFAEKPPEIAIPASVSFIAVGEGEGKAEAREGQHAAEPDAKPITAPPSTAATSAQDTEAPVETQNEAAKSTAQAPAQTQPDEGQVAEEQPPPSSPEQTPPVEAQAAPVPPAVAAPSPAPAPSETASAPSAEASPQSPQVAALPPPETAPSTPTPPLVEAPHAEPLPQPSPVPPAAPAAPSAEAKRPSPSRPRTPPKRADDKKASAPETPPKPQQNEPQIAVTPDAPPDTPKLPPASKFLATVPPGSGETHLPPASTINPDAPALPQSGGGPRLPSASVFKPGSPGDVQRAQRGPTGEAGGTKLALQSGGAKGFGKDHGKLIQEISELQLRIDRLLLVYSPDHPDVVALQREVDELFAQQGPLTDEELAPARRQLAECWARGAASLGLPNQGLGLSLVLDRDGTVQQAVLADASGGASAKGVLDMVRGCGPLPLPPERYLVWQKLTLQVGAR